MNSRRRPYRIILIEDNPHDLAELKAMLLRGSTRKYEFYEAQTANVGLHLCHTVQDVDCVVMDYDIPEMNAAEILQNLQRVSHGTTVPVVILTGEVDEQISRSIIRAGAQGFVGKSWMTPDSVTCAVEDAIERHRLAKVLARQSQRQSILLDTTRLMMGKIDGEPELIDLVFERISAHLDCDLGFYYRPVSSGDLRLIWQKGVPAKYAGLIQKVEPNTTFSGLAAQTLIPVIADAARITTDPLGTFARQLNLRAYACYPILTSSNSLIGTFTIASTRHDGFSPDDSDFLQTLSLSLAAAFERHRAEKASLESQAALSQSEERFRQIASTTDYVFWMKQLNPKKLLYVSPAYERVWQRPTTSLYENPNAWIDSVHSSDRARVDAAFDRWVADPENETYDVEYRIIGADGSIRCVTDRGQVVRDSEGKIYRLAGVWHDITALRQGEDSLRASEARQRLALTVGAMAIAEVDYAKDLIYMTPDSAKMYGLPPSTSSVSRLDIHAKFHPKDKSMLDELIAKSYDPDGDGIMDAEHRLLMPDGSVSWLAVRKQVFFDRSGRKPKRVRALLAMRDITQRKMTEQILVRRESELQTLADNVPDIIARFDREFRHVFVNAAVHKATGLPPDAFLGKTNRDLWMPAALCDTWETALSEVFESGKPTLETFALNTPDGERRYDSQLVPEFGADGHVEHVLAITRDVTATWNAGLELSHAKEAAESANAAKDQFLAVLSHELRTPLSPVKMALSMWERRLEDLPVEFRQDVEMMRRNVDLECRLIDDMLDLNRIARGKLEIQFAKVDLHAEIRHVVHTVEEDATAKQIVLSFDADAVESFVLGDAARLQQVLWNLLKNAIKFTPPGGSVAVRTYDTATDRIGIDVKDTGSGIESDILGKIFNAFEQGGTHVTRQFGGLGLGLAISKVLTEMHGGMLTASSGGKGLGATFTLDLEVAAPQEKSAADRAGGSSPVAHPIAPVEEMRSRILLVEDHQDTARLMKRLLGSLGHDVKIAGTVALALETADAYTFDLVISDLGLPDGNGYELMRELLKKHSMVGIALSGYGMEEDVKQGKDAGFVAHLTKPINMDQLEVTIQRILGKISRLKPDGRHLLQKRK